MRRVNEGLLPFHILHHSIVIISAFYIAQWNGPILPKYLLILGCTLGVTLPLYICLIKRVNLLRFLFGMRPKKRTAA